MSDNHERSEIEIRARGIGRRPNSHCVNGHAMTPDNVLRRGWGRRDCRICTNEKALAHRLRVAAWAAERTKQSADPNYFRERTMLRRYGITVADYEAMFASQSGLCAICRRPGKPAKNGKRPAPLVIDHDHATGKVRGLLCHACNILLPQIENKDFFDAAMAYLRLHGSAR